MCTSIVNEAWCKVSQEDCPACSPITERFHPLAVLVQSQTWHVPLLSQSAVVSELKSPLSLLSSSCRADARRLSPPPPPRPLTLCFFRANIKGSAITWCLHLSPSSPPSVSRLWRGWESSADRKKRCRCQAARLQAAATNRFFSKLMYNKLLSTLLFSSLSLYIPEKCVCIHLMQMFLQSSPSDH